MRVFLGVLLTLVTIAGKGVGPGIAGTPRDIVEQRFDAMNRHDIGALKALLADTVRGESVGWDSVLIGPTRVSEAYKRYFTSSPDLSYRVTRILDAGKSLTVEYTSEGTIEKNEPQVPSYMRGRHYVLKNCTIFDIDNGKIVHESTYFDQVSFLRQMGYFSHQAVGKSD